MKHATDLVSPIPKAKPWERAKGGKKLSQFSKKRKGKMARRAEVVEFVLARDKGCRASELVPFIKCAGRLDVHEIIPRSAWADGFLEPTNCVCACRLHHDWIGDHPEAAWKLGLHGFSYERPDRRVSE